MHRLLLKKVLEYKKNLDLLTASTRIDWIFFIKKKSMDIKKVTDKLTSF